MADVHDKKTRSFNMSRIRSRDTNGPLGLEGRVGRTMTGQNVKLNYLYRDASNYKKWGAVIFSNPDMWILEKIEGELTACLEDQMYFVASWVGIPEVFLFINDYPFSEDDHFFHEYASVEPTDEDVNDLGGRTIKEFVEQCNLANRKSWWSSEITY